MNQANHATASTWNPSRWKGIARSYTPADIDRLRGTVRVDYTLARLGAEKFWDLLRTETCIAALGAATGEQAVEMARAGLKAIYLGGAPAPYNGNAGSQVFLSNGVPTHVRTINNALMQADQVSHAEGHREFDWMLPIVADAAAGSGSDMDTFDLMQSLIEAGAAAVHFDDQVPHARKCGHAGSKELVPTEEATQRLAAARLATDMLGVATVIIARTDARSATLITSDYDTRDRQFLTGERTIDGCHMYRGGLQAAIARALAYAPYADLLWCETTEPNLHEARQFANAVHAQFPGKMLVYNCSAGFHWRAKLNEVDIACFQRDLAAMGYRFQFVNLADFPSLDISMYEVASDYARSGMTAYSQLQQRKLEMGKALFGPEAQHVTELARFNPPSVIAGDGHAITSRDIEQFEMHTEDYNDGEATERTPMPHLYPLLESMPLPSTAAND